MKIVLISDTHGFLDQRLEKYFNWCDEIWHAGDFGPGVSEYLINSNKKCRGVIGNIDSRTIIHDFPIDLVFEIDGLRFYMTHIGGYPGAYKPGVLRKLKEIKPGIFICGHSHIVKVQKDLELNLIHLNPGAVGNHGFHKMKSFLKFEIRNQKIENLELVELGLRSDISSVNLIKD